MKSSIYSRVATFSSVTAFFRATTLSFGLLFSQFSLSEAIHHETDSKALSVYASIKPLQLITQEITKGVADTKVLLANNTSPHDYALRPSDIEKIRSADLIVWVGEDLESFLAKPLTAQNNGLRLDQTAIELRKYAAGEGNEHAHHGHDHGQYDMHIWLGPDQAKQVAKAVSDKLAEMDVEHKAIYAQNYQSFVQTLDQTTAQIKQQLDPVKEHGYYVFHDAYAYFENYFGLNNLGHFTVSPDRRPGAKTLLNIRQTLQSEAVYCVFAEPQFKPAVIESTTRGTDVNQGQLDPLATEIEAKSGAYFEFLTTLSTQFSSCLAVKS